MKATVIPFKKPVQILQVYSNIVYYRKDEKSFTGRKEKLEWKPMNSINGHVLNGQLFLPERVLEHPHLQRATLITIVDDITVEHEHFQFMELNDCLVLDVPRQLGIFNVAQTEELELHLRHNPLSTEIPKREGFKICNLRQDEPVEVKINGKYDHSLFGSPRPRVFKEQQYIFHYLGNFTSFQVLKHPITGVPKQVPAHRKEISLLKPLW